MDNKEARRLRDEYNRLLKELVYHQKRSEHISEKLRNLDHRINSQIYGKNTKG